MTRLRFLPLACTGFLLLCGILLRAQQQKTLFQQLPSSRTGISFANHLTESDTLNILNQANIYNGGGVGIGDFNNDGLQDVYLAGNMVSNKLYLNKGRLKFEDITEKSGTGGEGRWCTGVAVVDINADGLLDLYVSASFRSDAVRRTNLLYINQGVDQQGMPRFKEAAKSYGLADTGFSTQGYFFDYDRDGDLDLYLVTNELNDPKTPIIYRPKVTDGSARNTDRLYRNNGDGIFTNISKQAGITIEGWGHAACISDFNRDGWPDVYVANDFISNDLLYINNGNGTFSNQLAKYFKHTSWNAMGTDAVDINNDGLMDLVSLEMLPESNLRKKTMLRGDEYYNYFNSRQYRYEHQYVRNVLQLNSGTTTKGHPVFSDVGYMAGVYQTDWSWCPLVADFDGDGFRDLIITNGLPRDVTDLDYVAYNSGQGGGKANLALAMVDSLPVVKLPNYAFQNTGGFQFRNTTADWGFSTASFSNGGAYADLDNDGDLDVVVNNINEEAFVYQNTLNDGNKKGQHFLSVAFEGEGKNRQGIGAWVHIYYGGKQQVYEHQPVRGYLSTVDDRAYFGLGGVQKIDSLRVVWPDGKTELLTNLPAGKTVRLSQAKGAKKGLSNTPNAAPFFATSGQYRGLAFLHQEKDAIDYNFQPTLPHKLSQFGPGIAVGDIDNNGHDDVYVGGSSGNKGVFFLQDAAGNFSRHTDRVTGEESKAEEDMGALLFDVDNDGDLDLYVVSGSYEFPHRHPTAQDRLYRNDGKGFFQRSETQREYANGSCVRAADYDGDGDLDLFVGGRSVSGAYPSVPESHLLRNDGGRLTDVTLSVCPELKYAGMVSDALWTDYDRDGKPDLVMAGEWLPLTFFRNTGTALKPVKETGLEQYTGWWNSLVAGDFDNDGDTDYIGGNLGLNTSFTGTPAEPMTLLAKDLDRNGQMDLMIFCYMQGADGQRRPYPMHARDDMVSQLVSIRKKYPTYKSYGMASLNELWSDDDRKDAFFLQATHLASSYIENKGNGKFVLTPLPAEAQVAPVFGMMAKDVNGDGNLDVVLAGNDYGMEPGSGRHDAFNGALLLGNGKGGFSPVPQYQSGLFLPGDAKALALLHTADGKDLLLATQNSDSLLVVAPAGKGAQTVLKWISLEPGDFCADITFRNGKQQRMEFYYGSAYLSQSSRKLPFEKGVAKIVITNFKGEKREVRE